MTRYISEQELLVNFWPLAVLAKSIYTTIIKHFFFLSFFFPPLFISLEAVMIKVSKTRRVFSGHFVLFHDINIMSCVCELEWNYFLLLYFIMHRWRPRTSTAFLPAKRGFRSFSTTAPKRTHLNFWLILITPIFKGL